MMHLGFLQWLPAILCGSAIAWCGIDTIGHVSANVLGVAATVSGPAFGTAVSSAASTRVLARYPLEMLDHGARVFQAVLGMTDLMLRLIATAVVVAGVGSNSKRFSPTAASPRGDASELIEGAARERRQPRQASGCPGLGRNPPLGEKVIESLIHGLEACPGKSDADLHDFEPAIAAFDEAEQVRGIGCVGQAVRYPPTAEEERFDNRIPEIGLRQVDVRLDRCTRFINEVRWCE